MAAKASIKALSQRMMECRASVQDVSALVQGAQSSAAKLEALHIAVRLMRANADAALHLVRLHGAAKMKFPGGEGEGGAKNIENEYSAKPKENQSAKKSRAKKRALKGAPLRRPGGQPGNANARKSGCYSAEMRAMRKLARRKIAALKAATTLAKPAHAPTRTWFTKYEFP